MRFNVKEIVPNFVAEIDNYPFNAIDETVISELRTTWTQYPLIRFRNTNIGDREQEGNCSCSQRVVGAQ